MRDRLTDRIKRAAEEAGMSINALAQAIGKPQPTVQHWVTGKRRVPADGLVMIARATRKPLAFFFPEGPKDIPNEEVARLLREEPRSYNHLLPLVGLAAAGKGISYEDLQEEVEWISLDDELRERGADIVIRVDGDSMAVPGDTHHTGLEDGDVVAIRRCDTWDEAKRGDVVLVTMAKHALLKEFRGIKEGRVNLLSWNPHEDPISEPVRKVTIRGLYVGHVHIAGYHPRRRKRAK